MRDYGKVTDSTLFQFAKAYAGKIFSPEEINDCRRRLLYFPAVQMIITDVENKFMDDEAKKKQSFALLKSSFITQQFEGRLNIFKEIYVEEENVPWDTFKEGLYQFLGETFLPTYAWLEAEHLNFAISELSVTIKFFREVPNSNCLLEYTPYEHRLQSGTSNPKVYE